MTQQEINSTSMLRIGTILRGTYRIDSYLSSGGFGNTYIATNIEFDERYAVKEFFMKGVTQRDDNQITVSVSNSENTNSFLEQREKFKKEARRLRQFNNQHIIRVHDMFEENGTAYYVMDYVDGENLSDHLKRTGCPMTESEVNLIFPQILDALKTVHDAGMWHLDLKPANIMLGKDGKVKIIDFGASKQLNVQKGGATTSTAISYTNGYAPREQMEQNYDKFGPWTDLYALGATLYNLLSNRRPPLPTDIDDDMTDDKHLALPLPEDVSAGMKNLILWMMQTNRMRRPQSIDELMHKLSSLWSDSSKPQNGVKDNEETIVASPKFDMTEETVVERSSPKSDKNNVETNETVEKVNIDDIDSTGNEGFAKIIICLIGAVVIIFIIWLIFFAHRGNRTEQQISPEEDFVAIDSTAWDSVACDSVKIVENNICYNGYIFIDLGLSVKWASVNFGAANSLSDLGGAYTWEQAKLLQTEVYRLPTKNEVQELLENCDMEWGTVDNMTGYLITGKTGQSIFLQAGDGSDFEFGQKGFYWTQTPCEKYSNNAWELELTSKQITTSWWYCNTSRSVRMVTKY